MATQKIDSQINIASEITRIRDVGQSKGKRSDDALTGPVSEWQLLAKMFSAIQNTFNKVNQRLAALEVLEIQDGVYPTAGVVAGFAIITVGNRQFKVEIREIS